MGTGTVSGAENNTAVGRSALTDITSADNNTAVGFASAGNITTGERNTAIGADALGLSTTGLRNVAIGNLAMYTSPSGVAVADMVAIGKSALGGGVHTTDANGTVAIGTDSLTALTSGAGNTAVGYQSLDATTTGARNTALGYQALTSLTDYSDNTAIGYNALDQGTSASHNTALGSNAGDVITTGDYNTIIGSGADPSGNNGQNQTVIGYNATGQADNSVTLGNASVTAVYMAQDSGATVYAGGMHIEKPNAQPVLLIGRAESDFSPGIVDNDILGELQFAGHEGSNTPNVVAKVLGVADESFGSTSGRGELQFQTGDESSTTTKMTITSSGVIDLPFGQLKFPATQNASSDANTLDDYEEGIFTPTLTTNGADFTSVTYDSLVKGKYTKIGNIVHIQGFMRTDAINKGSASGDVAIGGLPFTAGANTSGFANGQASISISNASGWTGENPSHGLIIQTTTLIQLYYADYNVDANNIAVADVTDGTSADKNALYFAGTYTV